jgi:hypothetical protein
MPGVTFCVEASHLSRAATFQQKNIDQSPEKREIYVCVFELIA